MFNGTCTHQVIHWSVLPSNVDVHHQSQYTVNEYGQFMRMCNGMPDIVARLKAKQRKLPTQSHTLLMRLSSTSYARPGEMKRMPDSNPYQHKVLDVSTCNTLFSQERRKTECLASVAKDIPPGTMCYKHRACWGCQSDAARKGALRVLLNAVRFLHLRVGQEHGAPIILSELVQTDQHLRIGLAPCSMLVLQLIGVGHRGAGGFCIFSQTTRWSQRALEQ